MIAIIETMDGKTFHRRVEKYTPKKIFAEMVGEEI